MLTYDSTLNKDEIALIETELAILEKIKIQVDKARSNFKLNRHKIGEGWKSLRDEAAKAKDSDLPALFDQMNTQRALIEHPENQEFPDSRSPYFARLQLQEGPRTKTILIGFHSFLETPKIPIIDWRHAPVSRIFFNYKVGDFYEEELPSRVAEGEVILRNILTIQDGKIVHISTGRQSFRLGDSDVWQHDSTNSLPKLRGGQQAANRQMAFGTGRGGLANPQVSALLDAQQFEILTQDPDEPLLVLGGAGCGKTTVALHRMALIHFKDPKKFSEKSMILVVPEPGLVRLSSKLLTSLGLRKVEVTTFDDWSEKQVRQVIRGLPKKVYAYTPGNVTRFKRSPLVTKAFPILVAQNIKRISIDFRERFYSQEIDHYLENQRLPLLQAVQFAEDELVRHWQKNEQKQKKVSSLRNFFRKHRKSILDLNKDRHDLFCTPAILKQIVAGCTEQLPEYLIKDVLKHSMSQFQHSTSSEYQDIDHQRLTTVDGRSLADEQQEDLAGSIDAEDFSIMLELLYFKTGSLHSAYGKLDRYQHMVLDEAQELAGIELNCLARSLKNTASITIAGDSAQQTDPTTSFHSWNEIVGKLRPMDTPARMPLAATELTTNYRSTKQIANFAHFILGSLAPAKMPAANREGVPISKTLFPTDGHMAIFLTESLTELMSAEANCSVAIITRNFDNSLKIYNSLKHLPKTRLVQDGEFSFRSGIDVVDVNQVKGLEFDYVILPDVSLGTYKDLPEHRRLLHVAATRAIHQLWVISVGKQSLLIKGAEDFY